MKLNRGGMKSHTGGMKAHIATFWMGGAIDVMGNVGESPYSEYNAYWNPNDTKSFIESGLEIKVLSLDSTNSVPADKNMLSKLSKIKKYEGETYLQNYLLLLIGSLMMGQRVIMLGIVLQLWH